MFLACLIAATFIDLDHRILPNKITYPSVVVAIVLVAIFETDDLPEHLIAGAAAFLFLFAAAWFYPKGMGVGDVKLAGVLGLWLGWLGWGELVVGAFAAFLLGGLFSIVLLATRRAQRTGGIPFGPWMLAGAWAGVLVGGIVAASYLQLLTLA